MCARATKDLPQNTMKAARKQFVYFFDKEQDQFYLKTNHY